ncbi:MAG: prefoldin subunit alpha [Candidatus Woesearchaeota archaeon]
MDKAIQQKYMEYQFIGEKIKQLQQQVQTIDEQTVEIMATIQSIDDFSSLKDKSSILVPINNGIFAKATLNKEDKLLVNVGAQIVVSKSLEETKGLIEKQKLELEKLKVNVAVNIQKLAERASILEKDLSAATG